MRGSQQNNISSIFNNPELQFTYHQDSNIPSQSQSNNLLDQAFIIYSDQEMMDQSSQSINSNLSFDAKSVALSHRSYASQRSNKSKNDYSNSNFLGNFANEESSIYDVRRSQCSESGRELIQSLEPLFKDKTFLRRSPRFAIYEQPINYSNKMTAFEKPFKIKKTQVSLPSQSVQMIQDEKSPLNQITQILQQKQEQHMLLNNTTCSNLNDKKIQENEMSLQSTIFPSVRQTRSSKKLNNIESQSTYSNNSRQNTNQYLSQITKDYILTARKQKKIKKAQKEKISNNGNQKGRQYHLRNN